jgi:hypothetical protein
VKRAPGGQTSRRGQTRDQLALARWIAGLGAVTAQAVACHLGVSVPSARARLAAAERVGLLAHSRPLGGTIAPYALTARGLRAIGAPEQRPCRVNASNARHLAVCALVAALLERRYPEHRVEGEGALRSASQGARAPLAYVGPGPYGRGPVLHRPDLVLWAPIWAETRPVAVEVELTVKSPARLLRITRAWARCDAVDGVLYLTTPAVERPLQRAFDGARGTGRLTMLPLAWLAPELGAL